MELLDLLIGVDSLSSEPTYSSLLSSSSSSSSSNPRDILRLLHVCFIVIGACYIIFAIFPFISVIRMSIEASKKRRIERATLLSGEYSSNFGPQWVCLFFLSFSLYSCFFSLLLYVIGT